MELAFVIPLVLLFLFGIIDFGLALNAAELRHQHGEPRRARSRVGDRQSTYASVQCNGTAETSLKAWVTCEAAATGAPTPSNVCVCDIAAGTSPSSTYANGDPIKVVVTSNFGWLKLLTGQISSLSSTISASATMRMEAAPSTGNNFLLRRRPTPLCTS